MFFIFIIFFLFLYFLPIHLKNEMHVILLSWYSEKKKKTIILNSISAKKAAATLPLCPMTTHHLMPSLHSITSKGPNSLSLIHYSHRFLSLLTSFASSLPYLKPTLHTHVHF